MSRARVLFSLSLSRISLRYLSAFVLFLLRAKKRRKELRRTFLSPSRVLQRYIFFAAVAAPATVFIYCGPIPFLSMRRFVVNFSFICFMSSIIYTVKNPLLYLYFCLSCLYKVYM